MKARFYQWVDSILEKRKKENIFQRFFRRIRGDALSKLFKREEFYTCGFFDDEFMKRYPFFKFKFEDILKSRNVSMEYYISQLSGMWIPEIMSSLPSVNPKYLLSNLDKEWDWDCLSNNPAIPLKFKKDTPHLGWNWDLVVEEVIEDKRVVTFDEFVTSFPRNVEVVAIFSDELKRMFSRAESISLIKRWWINKIWSPSSSVGKKRLFRSFQNEDYNVW